VPPAPLDRVQHPICVGTRALRKGLAEFDLEVARVFAARTSFMSTFGSRRKTAGNAAYAVNADPTRAVFMSAKKDYVTAQP
jgi:hypothetical protein